jgi:hypothetical protein
MEATETSEAPSPISNQLLQRIPWHWGCTIRSRFVTVLNQQGEYIYKAPSLFSTRAVLEWFFKAGSLKRGLESRSHVDCLSRLNLIPVPAIGISPRIAAKSVRLDKELKRDSLGKRLKSRPDPEEMRKMIPAIGVSACLAGTSVKLNKDLRRFSLSKKLDERESLESLLDSGILFKDPRSGADMASK